MHNYFLKYKPYSAIMEEEYTMSKEDLEEYSDKQQLTALMLAIFLGGVGGARFYIGHYVEGCLYLALFIVLMSAVVFIMCKYEKVNVIGLMFWCLSFLIWVGLIISDIVRFSM